MDKDDKQAIEDIESILQKRKVQKKKEVSQPAAAPGSKELAKDVVQELLQQLNKGPSGPAVAPGPAGGPAAGSPPAPGVAVEPTMDPTPQLKPSEEKYTIAKLTMGLAKNISILCMLVFILPFIAVLVTMMGQEMVALIISMVAMIYPAFLFVKSLGMQTYLSRKYGLKPLMRMPQQQQMMPGQQIPSQQQMPGQQQRKQNQDLF